ncbi:MAG: hypothetical protein ACYTAF_07900, partial [Planctomycetota bacterium]
MSQPRSPEPEHKRHALAWILSGALLVLLVLLLRVLSPQFDIAYSDADKPIWLLVALMLCAGLVYLLAVWYVRRAPSTLWMILWAVAVGIVLRVIMLVAVGIVLRVIMLGSTPILEDDYYRYLWDGAVTANGHNPYEYSPQEVLDGGTPESPIPPGLTRLARESGEIIHRINHPHLRSSHPPVTQAAFSLAHRIHPWDMVALRAALFCFDALTLLVLILLLRHLKLPLVLIAVYWWNPLLIKEIFNSGHMEVVVLPFVLAALLLAARGSTVIACGALALAVGIVLRVIMLGSTPILEDDYYRYLWDGAVTANGHNP